LARARIVCHHSPRHKCGRRAFEAAAAGALIFQEATNRELPTFFRDRQECVYYQPDDLEALLEHYLEHEDARHALTEAARVRVRNYSFAAFWEGIIPEIAEKLPQPPKTAPPHGVEELLTRCWQALFSSGRFADTTLIADLEKALEGQPHSAELCN